MRIQPLFFILLMVGISACETPGSKALTLSPQLDLALKKEPLGFLVLNTIPSFQNLAKGDDNLININIADKQSIIHDLFKQGFTEQGWTVIDKGSPLLPVPNPTNVDIDIKKFNVYLIAETTKDIVNADLSVALTFNKDEKQYTQTISKRSDQAIAIKAQNEHVIRFAEEALAKFVAEIVEKDYLRSL